MTKIKKILYIALIILGIWLFRLAGIDDSPGGQLIGVLVGLIGIVRLVKK